MSKFWDQKLYGHYNNAMVYLGRIMLLDYNGWNKRFEPYACGNYRNQVLTVLDGLRTNSTTEGFTSWEFNGLDYAPVRVYSGMHRAAMIYPRVTDGRTEWTGSRTVILDPWLSQDPNLNILTDWGVGATYASAAAYNWTEWATAYAVFSPGLGPLLAGLAEADVEDNPNFAAAGSRDTATPASYAVGPDFTSRMYGSLLVQCPVYATLVDDQGRRTGWKPNAGPNEFPFLAEIPDARFWEGSEANGSAGWMLALPRTRVTAILTAYGTGTANIMFGSGEKTPFVFQDVPVSAGDTATVVLDRSDPNPPVLRFASGRTVQATLLGPNACVPAGGSQFTVTRGGYRYNNTTKRYTQVVTFKNNASQALSGRLSLVLANLSANASLVDQSGLTNCAAPANSVYIDIPLPSGLPAGGTASASLDFINPTNQAITYEPRVYAGVGNR